MSCDVAMSAAILLASFNPAAQPALQPTPVVAVAPGRVNPLAKEPLYADIIGRASELRREVKAYEAGLNSLRPLPHFEQFKQKIAKLAELDMQGHMDLLKRMPKDDLKCILKGISQDLPRKLNEVEQASTLDARKMALEEMFYLLRDNVEVITTPPVVQSTDRAA